MKINSFKTTNPYINRDEKARIDFKSMPNGEFCTSLFRSSTQWETFTPYTIMHFQKELSNKQQIKILSHFCSDCSELYSYILDLTKNLGYKTVKEKFRFEARDINHEMIDKIKNREIFVIKKTLDGSETDIDRLKKHLGKTIKINGKKIKIEDLFIPQEEMIKDTSSKFYGFQKCKVNKDLASLITVKQENIKDFLGENFNIIFVKNNLSCLGENALENECKGIIEKIKEGTANHGMTIVSKYDAARFDIGEKFQNAFKCFDKQFKGIILYLK